MKSNIKQVALLLLSYRCLVSASILWLFLAVPWVGLQCVITVVPDRTQVHFFKNKKMYLELHTFIKIICVNVDLTWNRCKYEACAAFNRLLQANSINSMIHAHESYIKIKLTIKQI